MENSMESSRLNRIVIIWLYIGVFMVFMQVIIGGVTRLTGSGLSITKWEIITGTFPPMNTAAWEEEFDLYKATPQYQKINQGMTMSQFKFIYFWEYFHRLWARSIGFVFLFPFLFFVWKKWIDPKVIRQLGDVVLLAMVVAAFGWIMVKSGLSDRPWVSAYKLTMHLSLALILYAYLFWTAISAHKVWLKKGNNVDLTNKKSFFHNELLRSGIKWILFVLALQIVLGGLMSGMKAAVFYPSFPKIGEEWIPSVIFEAKSWTTQNFIMYDTNLFLPALVHLLHRYTAYILTIMVLWFVYKASKVPLPRALGKGVVVLGLLLLAQVFLGIFTVINSARVIPVALGVFHQAGAVLLLSSALFVFHEFKYPRAV